MNNGPVAQQKSTRRISYPYFCKNVLQKLRREVGRAIRSWSTNQRTQREGE